MKPKRNEILQKKKHSSIASKKQPTNKLLIFFIVFKQKYPLKQKKKLIYNNIREIWLESYWAPLDYNSNNVFIFIFFSKALNKIKVIDQKQKSKKCIRRTKKKIQQMKNIVINRLLS